MGQQSLLPSTHPQCPGISGCSMRTLPGAYIGGRRKGGGGGRGCNVHGLTISEIYDFMNRLCSGSGVNQDLLY